MFCNHCGKTMDEGAKFCSGCGGQAQSAAADVSSSVVSKDMGLSESDIRIIQDYNAQGDLGKADMKKKYPHINFEAHRGGLPKSHLVASVAGMPLGKSLASGNGEGNSAINKNWLIGIVIGAITVGLLIFMANEFGYTQVPWVGPVRNNAYSIYIGFAVVAGVVAIVDSFIKDSRIKNTRINVYESGVTGKSVPAKFPWTFTSYSAMSEFQLGFNQIMSVDVLNENCVVIHVVGASHKCYCLKPNEIRDAIIKQMNDVKYQSAARPNECGCGHINPEGMKFCGKCGSPL